jgi:hypothetical protein
VAKPAWHSARGKEKGLVNVGRGERKKTTHVTMSVPNSQISIHLRPSLPFPSLLLHPLIPTLGLGRHHQILFESVPGHRDTKEGHFVCCRELVEDEGKEFSRQPGGRFVHCFNLSSFFTL